MKKKALLVVPVAAIAALSIAACGGSSTKVANSKPAPVATVASAQDVTFCHTARLNGNAFLAALGNVRHANSDAAAERLIKNSVLPKLGKFQSDVTQLRGEATAAADKRRLSIVATGLGQMYGGLVTLASGTLSGQTALDQGIGTLSSARGLNTLSICGGGRVQG